MCGLLPIPDGRLAALASTGQVPQQAVIQQVEELEDHPDLVVPVPASRVYDSVSTRCSAAVTVPLDGLSSPPARSNSELRRCGVKHRAAAIGAQVIGAAAEGPAPVMRSG